MLKADHEHTPRSIIWKRESQTSIKIFQMIVHQDKVNQLEKDPILQELVTRWIQ